MLFVNNEIAQKFINNKAEINDDVTKISKQEFEGWTNLVYLKIPESVKEIENGTFANCLNIHYLECDPKWFSYIPKTDISSINIPKYIKELKSDSFKNFSGLKKIVLPNDIIIKDSKIFDECENLTDINCNENLFIHLSMKTKIRCHKKETTKYNINAIQPESKRIHDEVNNINCNEVKPYNKELKEMTTNDLMTTDSSKYKKYQKYIEKVMFYIDQCPYPKKYKPENTTLEEISNICGVVCHEIKNEIILRPVQILSILVLLDEILNNNESHGSIGEIKTGEGKSIIITILAIILTKYEHNVDIVTPNLELAKRDQKNQSHFFKLFNIQTGVLFHLENDEQFMKSYIRENRFSNKSGYNIEIFKNPVVYSTNGNFEFAYLHSLTTISKYEHKFDIVLIDEVDSMFIDELDEPAIISESVKYSNYEDILKTVFLASNERSSTIAQSLNEATGNTIIFKESDIELLKRAANKAMNLHPKIDYLVRDNEIIIIDQSTHYQKKGSRFNQYVHEMLHIKENIQVEDASHPIMQITQHAYFNLYRKIIGVTGTIGSKDDEKLLMNGYKVNVFKFPRNRISQLEVYLKKRPDSIQNIFDMVSNEITKETNKGRPVIVIWDSIKCAEDFIKSNEYLNAQKITAEDVISDRDSIKNAGKAKSVTVATLAVGRGVDIIVSNESLEAGGLHVIIPMCMRNQRSLEQAVGRTGRQGQPGSVSIYISNYDQYEKNPKFVQKDENLLNIELEFWKYMKTTYKWMLVPLTYNFPQTPIFPFGADYKMAMKILSKYIVLFIYRSSLMKDRDPKNIIEIFRNLSLRMTQISWLFFFYKLYNDENVNDYEHCKDQYNDFIKELNEYFPQNKNMLQNGNNVQNENNVKDEINAQNVLDYMKNLISITDDDVVYESGIKITATLLDVMYSQDSFLEKVIRYIFNLASPLIKNKISWQKISSGSLSVLKHFLISKGYLKSAVQMNSFNTICDAFNGLFSKKKEAKFPTFKNIATNLGQNLAHVIMPDKTVKKKIHYENKIPLLTNDFIRKTMDLANWIYDKYQNELDQYNSSKPGQSEFPKPVIGCYTPYFYCKDELDTRYVLIKGTNFNVGGDVVTDLSCTEISEEINGKLIHFHKGFFIASQNIYKEIINDLGKFEKIYFIGHSYGASVASILCLLAKSNKDLSDKEIYAMAFAPAPAMSYCPEDIADCIFVFINNHDPIPRCCAYNISKALDHYKDDNFIQTLKEFIEKNEIPKNIVEFIKVIVESILNGIIDVKNTQVRTVKGVIFSIGLFETSNLNDCRILDENDIGDELNINFQEFADHRMKSYIETFNKYFA